MGSSCGWLHIRNFAAIMALAVHLIIDLEFPHDRLNDPRSNHFKEHITHENPVVIRDIFFDHGVVWICRPTRRNRAADRIK